MYCKLCEKEKKLIKAHAIPEAFFRELMDDWRAPKLMTNVKGEYTKKAPIGVYDTGILCTDCEKIFGDWDNYGVRTLLKEKEKFKEIHNGREVVALYLNSFNYKLLKLFFVSALWRASVSSQPFYSKVKLGSYENKAREMILKGNPAPEDVFSVVLSNFVSVTGKDKLARTVMDPFPERWQGVNAYRMYFGRICAYIKVDQRPYPETLRKLVMRAGQPLFIVNRVLETSSDVNAMVAVVKGSSI